MIKLLISCDLRTIVRAAESQGGALGFSGFWAPKSKGLLHARAFRSLYSVALRPHKVWGLSFATACSALIGNGDG